MNKVKKKKQEQKTTFLFDKVSIVLQKVKTKLKILNQKKNYHYWERKTFDQKQKKQQYSVI